MELPESLVRINSTAFAGTGIKHIKIPQNVEFIDQFTFLNTYLESISVESGNKYFSSENGVLYNKDKTKIIKFPTLKDGSYVMPDLVTTDYDDMPIFYDCTRLTDVTLGEKYLKDTCPLGYGMGIEFIGCVNLQNINCSPKNQYYDAIDGVLFSKDKKTLLVFPSGRCGVYSVPDGTTNIGIGAFVNCINLSGIVIPDSVTKIANQSIGYSGNYGEKPKLMDNIANFTIYGKPGSVAETYANENGIPFKDSSTDILPTEISLNYFALTENIGNTVIITATVTPQNSIDQNVMWSSSDNNVATVSNGKVTAISAGKATITAKTNNGKIAVCVVTVNDVLKNTSSVSKTKVNLGDVVNINGNATGGTGDYQYAVYYKKISDTKWTTKQNFNTNSQITVKPAKPTTYDICVKVKDSSDAIVKKYFKVEVTQFTNVSTLSATSINFGNTVTVNAKATGGTGNYQYAVYYKKTSDTKWTTKQDFNTNAKVIVKPAKATVYDICVKVKDSSNTVVKKYFKVNVTQLTNTSTLSTTSIKLGDTVKVSCSAKGSTGFYQYAVYYKKTSETKWTIKQSYSGNYSTSIKPAKATTYDVCVKVKDNLNNEAKKYFILTVE